MLLPFFKFFLNKTFFWSSSIDCIHVFCLSKYLQLFTNLLLIIDYCKNLHLAIWNMSSSSNQNQPTPSSKDESEPMEICDDAAEEEKIDMSNLLEPSMLKLSPPMRQYFSFPPIMIYDIAKNANEKTRRKLTETCKSMKLIVQSYEDHVVEKIHARHIKGCEYVVAPKSLKVVDTLDLMFLTEKNLEKLFKKLDISTIQTIHFFSCLTTFPLSFFNYVLQPTAVTFWCTAHFDTPISPTLKAFEVLQNAKEIYQTCIYNALTKSDFKKLLQIKRKTKLEVCGIAVNKDVDKEDIIEFLDVHMMPRSPIKSRLTLCIRGVNDKVVPYVNEVLEKRRQTSDEVPDVKIEFRYV